MKTGKAILGMLGGIAVGTIVGMLVASRRDRARDMISRKSADLAEAFNSKIDQKFEELLTRVADKVKKIQTENFR